MLFLNVISRSLYSAQSVLIGQKFFLEILCQKPSRLLREGGKGRLCMCRDLCSFSQQAFYNSFPHHSLLVHSLKFSPRWVTRLCLRSYRACAQACMLLWSYVNSRNIINVFQASYKHLALLCLPGIVGSLFLALDDLTASDSCDFEQLSQVVSKSDRNGGFFPQV